MKDISIHFISSACNHHHDMKIVIVKEGEKFIGLLYRVRPYFVKVKRKSIEMHKPDTLLETITLTKDNINSFIKFENELNIKREVDCTTHDWYKVESQYLNIEKNDRSCDWSGYRIILEFFQEDSYKPDLNPLKLKSEFAKKRRFHNVR